LVNPLNYYLS